LQELAGIKREKETLEIELDKVSQVQDTHLAELSKVNQEKEDLEAELGRVRQEKRTLEIEVDTVRQELSNAKKQIPNLLPNNEKKSNYTPVPKRVGGWGVQFKGNYYRLFKKIDGKVKWIHIGRKWDLDLAKRKIKDFAS
jgi:hypothetical protein